jgi:hypothetical protein
VFLRRKGVNLKFEVFQMKRSMLVALIATLFLPIFAFAQGNLQAFTDAVNEMRGRQAADKHLTCDTIPYSDLRGNCKTQGDGVRDWCDGKNGPVSCQPGGAEKLRLSLITEHRNVDRLEGQLRDLNDKRDHASDENGKNKYESEIEAAQKEIQAANERIENLDRDVENQKELVEKTLGNIDKCIRYREAQMAIFAEALEKVHYENEASIKPLANELKAGYPQETKGHQEQIEVRKKSEENCEKEKP